MITTYPRAEGENWTEPCDGEGSSKTSGFHFPRARPCGSIGADRVDVPRFELANLCAQEQRLILKGFLLGLKAASRLR
jgi:hypothetical protein